MTSVFFAFTSSPFLSILIPAIPPLCCVVIFRLALGLSTSIAKSAAYSPHNYSFLTLSLNTSSTITNRKGFSGDPWCKPTVTRNPAYIPHAIHTLVVATLSIYFINLTRCSGTPSLSTTIPLLSGHTVKCILQFH